MAKPEQALRVDMPDSKYIDRKLNHLDDGIRNKVLRSSMVAAAAPYRKAMRQGARKHKDSGDLARSVISQIRKSRRTGRFYALIGVEYGKRGSPPRSPQDPGVYGRFVESGASRGNRGRVAATYWASRAVGGRAVAEESTSRFAIKFKQRLHLLT